MMIELAKNLYAFGNPTSEEKQQLAENGFLLFCKTVDGEEMWVYGCKDECRSGLLKNG